MVLNQVSFKKCSKCSIDKPTTEFHFRNKAANRVSARCRECISSYISSNYAQNRDKKKEQSRLRRKEYYQRHRAVELERAGRYRENNKEVMRGKRLLKNFGLTLDEWNAMHTKQEGKCLICKKIPKSTMHTDHEHVKGYSKMPSEEKKQYVRGLVCYTCNLYKIAKNDLKSAKAIVEYLEAYESKAKKLP